MEGADRTGVRSSRSGGVARGLRRHPEFHKQQAQLGGLAVIAVYVPILIAFCIGMLALFSLPRALVTYRELGILRRLSTTPLPPSWVLAAQLVINFVLAVWTLVVLVVVGAAAFGVARSQEPGRIRPGLPAGGRRAVCHGLVGRGGGPRRHCRERQ